MTQQTTPQTLPLRSESGMNTRAINSAAGVLLAAIQQGRQTPTGLALALDSACLLNSPEHATQTAQMRARVAELETEAVQRRAHADQVVEKYVKDLGAYQLTGELQRDHIAELEHQVAYLEAAAAAGRSVLAAFCHDLEDPGTAALGALYLLQQATPGVPMERGETVPKAYRASHESIVMGLYLTAAEARAHCVAEELRAWAKDAAPVFDWIEDEEDGVAELVTVDEDGETETVTGYVVTALDIAPKYDEEADE